MTDHDQPWSRRIALTDVPEEGLHLAMEADAEVDTTINAMDAGLRTPSARTARRRVSWACREAEMAALVRLHNDPSLMEPVAQSEPATTQVTHRATLADRLRLQHGIVPTGAVFRTAGEWRKVRELALGA